MRKFLLIFFGFSLFLGAIFHFTTTEKTTGIIKSPNDQREYLAITLSNQLEVLLISDATTDKASAALDVNVGSADDPDTFLGLAHFLEHMLFLGTKKYPTPDEYQKFISDHGGSHNAFTSLDHTNYFFDIQADFLEEALDRFSQQFISPLFNEDYVQREVNAVHSEYTSKLKDDGRRFFSALKASLAPNHPYRKFSVGNLETLKDLPEKKLRDALLDFYAQHYSANKMRLVVLGKEPLAVLKSWAEEKFSAIPNQQLPKQDVDIPFFAPGQLPMQLNVKSIMDKRSLTVAFPVPSDAHHKDSQPLSYIANLLGHEGKGSLLSKLKRLDLVDGLSAGAEFDTQKQSILLVSMSLTQKGLDNTPQILDILFDYIDLIKREGIKDLYFKEQATLLDIAFKFQEKAEPIHYTSALAMALHESKAETILVESYDLKSYKPKLYLSYLEKLTPENMLIALSAQSVETDQKTEWFDAPYQIRKLDNELIETLTQIDRHDDLHMPHANEFIPENTELLGTTADTPKSIYKEEGLEVWYGFDGSFGTPKANIFLTLRSPLANQTANHQNENDLLVDLLKDALNEFSYPALLAGLNFELYQHMRGITVKISGYHDKQSHLLSKIINTLMQVQFSEERFAIMKERLSRQLQNAKERKPFEQAISHTQNLLITPSWNEEQRLLALQSLTLNDIHTFRANFLAKLEAALLINGNITQDQALKIAKKTEDMLLKEAEATNVHRAKIAKLGGKTLSKSSIKVNHPDTGFVYYLQGAEKSITEQATFLLLSQAISTDYYASIRTDKQLGYIVFATSFELLDVPALAFIVQSPVASGDNLLSETQAFLAGQVDKLQALDEATLSKLKAAVNSKLLKQDNNLYTRSNRYWQDIDRENTEFDTNQDLANAVDSLTKEDLITKLNELINHPGRGIVVDTQEKHAENTDTSESLSALADSLNVKPISKSDLVDFF